MKMKCDKCTNKPWKECCNNCKELEYSCYVGKNMVKVKDYIKNLGYHHSDPDQYLTCSMRNVYKHISLHRFRNRIVDYVFIFIDIDMVILEINSERMFISIIFKKTQINTNHCVSTDLSVFDCAIIVRFLS